MTARPSSTMVLVERSRQGVDLNRDRRHCSDILACFAAHRTYNSITHEHHLIATPAAAAAIIAESQPFPHQQRSSVNIRRMHFRLMDVACIAVEKLLGAIRLDADSSLPPVSSLRVVSVEQSHVSRQIPK